MGVLMSLCCLLREPSAGRALPSRPACLFAFPEQFPSFLSERDITLAQIARGRMREFYQCDLDIAGAYPGMAADAEVVSVRSAACPAGPPRSDSIAV